MIAMKDKLVDYPSKGEHCRQKNTDKEHLEHFIKPYIADLEEKMTKTFQQKIDHLSTDCYVLKGKNAILEAKINQNDEVNGQLRAANVQLHSALEELKQVWINCYSKIQTFL